MGEMACPSPTGTLKRPRLIGLKVKNEYFFYRREDCLDVFVEKMNKILSGFAHFCRQKIDTIYVEKREHKVRQFVTYVGQNLIEM